MCGGQTGLGLDGLPELRVNLAALFAIAMAINIGMWLERFMIVVISLKPRFHVLGVEDVLPTRWDIFTFFGTVGLFSLCCFSFIRFLPLISIFEMRELVNEEASQQAGVRRKKPCLAAAFTDWMAEFRTPEELLRRHAARTRPDMPA